MLFLSCFQYSFKRILSSVECEVPGEIESFPAKCEASSLGYSPKSLSQNTGACVFKTITSIYTSRQSQLMHVSLERALTTME